MRTPSRHPNVVMLPATEQQPTTRHKLFGALIAAGCELIALGAEAACALVASREPDAQADAHVEEIDRLAGQLMQDAAEGVLTRQRACQVGLLIRSHCDGYRATDAAEDSWIGKALASLQRLVRIVRGMNRALDHELAKRGVRVGVVS